MHMQKVIENLTSFHKVLKLLHIVYMTDILYVKRVSIVLCNSINIGLCLFKGLVHSFCYMPTHETSYRHHWSSKALATELLKIFINSNCLSLSGSNILLARLATRVAKPDNYHYVAESENENFIKKIKVQSLPGLRLLLAVNFLFFTTYASFHSI